MIERSFKGDITGTITGTFELPDNYDWYTNESGQVAGIYCTHDDIHDFNMVYEWCVDMLLTTPEEFDMMEEALDR